MQEDNILSYDISVNIQRTYFGEETKRYSFESEDVFAKLKFDGDNFFIEIAQSCLIVNDDLRLDFLGCLDSLGNYINLDFELVFNKEKKIVELNKNDANFKKIESVVKKIWLKKQLGQELKINEINKKNMKI